MGRMKAMAVVVVPPTIPKATVMFGTPMAVKADEITKAAAVLMRSHD